MRPREFLDALTDPSLPRCSLTGEQAESLRTLLVHLYFADLDLDKRELAQLERVLPDLDRGIRDYIKSAATRRLDLDRLAALFPAPADRDDIVTLAEHAAWGDATLKARERSLIERLADTLGVLRTSS